MKRNKFVAAARWGFLFVFLLSFLPCTLKGQQNVVINLAPIDGVAITPDNIFDYQMQSFGIGKVQVKGIIKYENSNLSISYSFPYTLRQGINMISPNEIHPQWQFSSSALQELFLTYKVLPAGTFEYCVTITPAIAVKETPNDVFDECLYHREDDIFLINLIHPDDSAKLDDSYPLLSWIANYSFSSQLTYRLRIAEILQGQNAVNAIRLNQPVYDESNLSINTLVYPVYAKPLVAGQPYAWAVDAYFNGLLLGESETWLFIIPPDTLPAKYNTNRSYIDIRKENGTAQLYILGQLKLKYLLDKVHKDVLSIQLINENKESVAIRPQTLNAVYGDNRYILDLKDSCNLKHMTNYTIVVKSTTGETYSLPFKYIDPDKAH